MWYNIFTVEEEILNNRNLVLHKDEKNIMDETYEQQKGHFGITPDRDRCIMWKENLKIMIRTGQFT